MTTDNCFLQDMAYKHGSPPVAVSCMTRHAGLPARYIQHCQIPDLYWQMTAEWSVLEELAPEVGPCPSYETFRKRYAKVWKHMLPMRTTSQHSQCTICFDLQRILHAARVSWQDKCKAAQALKKHLRDQYTDRLMYWSLRFASKVHNDVLVIIIDDMDHSKFAWPRWSFRKVTHELDRIIRPTLTFTGALAHGWGTYLYMAGPQVLGGSDYFLEVLSQTIECVFQQACRPAGHQSRGLPSHLVVVADNTVKSAKNQHVVLFLAYLVSRGLFKSATLFHLMVGHTHEDIDQLFALILALLKRKGHWETPQEILQHIAQSTLACD